MIGFMSLVGRAASQASTKLFTLRTLGAAGVLRPQRPDRLLQSATALLRFGPTPAAGYTISARRYPDAPAIFDELGSLTFREVHERSNALANALSDDGL